MNADTYTPFPTEALPEPLRSYVATVAHAIGCDAAFVALPALAACASCIGTSYRVVLKGGWSEPAVLWTLTVGRSGTLKSPALNCVLGPLREAQARAVRDYEQALAGFSEKQLRYGKRFRAWKRAKEQGDCPLPPKAPTLRRTLVSDVTVEALALILQTNTRGVLLARDEFAGFTGSFDRYTRGGRGADAPTWCSVYDAGPIQVDRKGGKPHERTIFVPAAAVSICGTIQPRVLRKVFSEQLRAGGLLARLMLAWPPAGPKLWTEEHIPPDVEVAWTGLVSGLRKLAPGVSEDGTERARLIPLRPDAQQQFIAWHDDHAREIAAAADDDLAAALSKHKGLCPRIALVLHCVQVVAGAGGNDGGINLATIEAAIRIVEWTKLEARRVLRLFGSQGNETAGRSSIDDLATWIASRGGQATVRDVMRGPRRYQNNAAAAEADLEKLVATGRGRWDYVGTGGRPLKLFRLVECADDNDKSPRADPAKPGSVIVEPAGAD